MNTKSLLSISMFLPKLTYNMCLTSIWTDSLYLTKLRIIFLSVMLLSPIDTSEIGSFQILLKFYNWQYKND